MPLLAALFDLNGTATRKRAVMVFAIAALALNGMLALKEFAPHLVRFAAPAFGLIIVWWLATAVRRLHDAGRSGAWALTMAIPLLGIISVIAILSLRQDRPFNAPNVVLRALGSIGLVVLAVHFCLRLFWAPFWIPAESMKPTLLVGDYFAMHYAAPESLVRGDVVVFRHPVNTSEMVKRLIGLPGDTVQMQNGVLFVNGAAAPQTDAGVFEEVFEAQGPLGNRPRCANQVVGEGGICEKLRFTETLPGGTPHAIVNIEATGFADNTDLFTVPQKHYFFLGDNRDNSIDSRFAQTVGGLGFVPAENLMGRATRVLFSSAGRHLWAVWDWRSDRYLKAIE